LKYEKDTSVLVVFEADLSANGRKKLAKARAKADVLGQLGSAVQATIPQDLNVEDFAISFHTFIEFNLVLYKSSGRAGRVKVLKDRWDMFKDEKK